MAKTDKELFDALSKGDELNVEDGATVETEFEVITEAEPEEASPEPVEEEAPEQETEPEAEAEAETDEPEAEAEPEQEEDEGDKPSGVQIPKAQYDRIRAKQKAAEELAAKRAEENATLNGRLQQIERMLAAQQQPQAQQPQEPVEEPDPITDPEGYAVFLENRMTQQVRQVENRFINQSIARARREHGQLADEAYTFVNENGTPEIARAILASDDPGEELVRFYNRQKMLSEVGDDPNAFVQKTREDVRAEMLADPAIREELLAEMRGSASPRKPDGSPAIKTAPSLTRGSRAADARPQSNDPLEGLSDEAIFAQMSRKG